MALFSAPDPHSQRFDLPSGASRQLRLRGGATVICVSGRVLVAEPAYRSELPPGTYLPPPTRLHAGESFFLPEGGDADRDGAREGATDLPASPRRKGVDLGLRPLPAAPCRQK